ncbi:MAG: divergent polysaccharide deacetylase family protein, partial [Candidatus Latescibacteria bacterium]|nr:divergent polysaccharide deacetylase family protein [Candidatus Latescibacterota bacterium]
RLLVYAAPLIAVIALGASLFVWYRALVPETERITFVRPSLVSPQAFSAGLEGNLLLVLDDFGIDSSDVKISAPDPPREGIRELYTVTVPENVSLTLLNLKITLMARDMGGKVFRAMESGGGRRLALTVGAGSRRTDIIVLRKKRGVIKKTFHIAVIVDDLGIKSTSLAKRLCNLRQVVTLAILPFQRRTSEVVAMAKRTETPYILHMPMEPKSSAVNPGEGAILIADDEKTIIRKLDNAFDSVKGAPGLNNHMGSKATEDRRTMEYLMRFLGKRGRFFLDSQTSRQSVGFPISQKAGVKSAMISGYIDVKDDEESIAGRFDTLAGQAIDKGAAIILGHDRPNTVAVLERKMPEWEKKGIRFVPLSELVR